MFRSRVVWEGSGHPREWKYFPIFITGRVPEYQLNILLYVHNKTKE